MSRNRNRPQQCGAIRAGLPCLKQRPCPDHEPDKWWAQARAGIQPRASSACYASMLRPLTSRKEIR